MRQLRLKREDEKYIFFCHGDISDKTLNSIKIYLDEEAERIKKHSFQKNPLLWEDENSCYQVGYVPCEKESVVSLPKKGSVLAAGSEGGFIVAAECKNQEIG